MDKERYVITGIDQDTTPDKRTKDVCYDAENIRIINNGANLSVKPIKSATELVSSGSFDSDDYIIGHIEIKEILYIFTTDNASTPNGSSDDKIRKVETNGTITNILTGNFYFSNLNPIEAVANYENTNIIKIYWTDGYNVLRFINVEDPSTKINIVEEADLNQPTLTSIITGGDLVAGNIQYVYSLYNLNGSESILSVPSELISLTRYFEGKESGEDSGVSVQVDITLSATPDLANYDYIRIYSIHWTELNQIPAISMIADEALTGTAFTFIDDGNAFISSLTELALFSVSGRPLVVGTLAAKRNRLFIANYSTANFDVNIDVRAFAHSISSTNYRVKNVDGSDAAIRTLPTVPGTDHDCVNYQNDPRVATLYGYQQSSTSRGAEGVNMVIGFDVSQTFSAGTIPNKSLKQGEVYRIGVIFFNSYGQASPAKWVCDIKVPELDGLHYIIGLTSQLENIATYIAAGVVSYQMVAVERKKWDRTIVSQGFLVPGCTYETTGGSPMSPYVHPYYISKDIIPVASTLGGNIHEDYEAGKDFITAADVGERVIKDDTYMFFYSTDTIFEDDLDSVEDIRVLGVARMTGSVRDSTRIVKYEDGEPITQYSAAGTLYDGYTTYIGDANWVDNILGPSDTTASSVVHTFVVQFYKAYSGFEKTDDNSGLGKEVNLDTTSTFVKKGETKNITGKSTVSNAVDVEDIARGIVIVADTPSSYTNKFCGCVALTFASATWHREVSPGSVDWKAFYGSTTLDSYRRLPIVELIRSLPNQYGGASYEAKQRNDYLITGSKVAAIEDSGGSGFVITHYLGDMYVGPLHVNRSDPEHDMRDFYFNIYEYVVIPWMENNHNVFGRSDQMKSWGDSVPLNQTFDYELYRIDDNHKLLSAYNQQATLFKALSKPANFTDVDEYPNVIQASKEKFPNEVIDSWTKFLVNETRPIEGTYGSIQRLYNFKGEIIAFQDSAIAIISINPRIQTQAVDGVAIELGIGAVLYDHKYLTTVSGISDKFAVANDNKNLYYYDRTFNTINALADEKISTLLGIKQILDDNASTGITDITYNSKYDEVLFSANDYAIMYSPLLGKFFSKHNHETDKEGKYMMLQDKLLYKRSTQGIWEMYTGAYKAVKITYLFCPAVGTEKVFHNLEYRLIGNVDFDGIMVTGNLNVSALETPTIYNKFDIHRIHLPRMATVYDRFREHYIFVKLYINSTPSSEDDFRLDDMTVMYNIKG